MRCYLTLFFAFLHHNIVAQELVDNDTAKGTLLKPVTIQNFKTPIKLDQTSFYIKQLNDSILLNSTSINNAYLLRDAGGVFVQQSQLGGGSPIIRGFEASRILLVVDGVRMNNAIFRTGHLQNILTIDKNVVDQIDIVHGSNSTLYGTDALGGIIDIRTKDLFGNNQEQKPFQILIGSQYNSAFNSINNNLNLQYGTSKFAGLTAVSYNKIGDLMQGSKYRNYETEIWKRNEYISTVNNEDYVNVNKNPNKQIYSGYAQLDILQKLSWKFNNSSKHSLNFQYSTSTDIPRYDRLTDRRNGALRWAEWYYGPQKRLLTIYTFEKQMSGLLDLLTANLNYQNIQESRFQRAFQNNNRQSRIEDLNILGYSIDVSKKINNRNKFQLGTDAQLNFLKSTAYYLNIISNEKDYNLDSRYPDGVNRMNFFGLYSQYFYTSQNNRFNIHSGLRINYATLYSQFLNTATLLQLPFQEAKQDNFTYSAHLGAVYKTNRFGFFTASISSAFRVPNIDDLAKVFESAGGVQLVVPNPNLKPEQAITFDLGYRYNYENQFQFSLNGFYTFFRNAIVLDRFALNGQDSILYDGTMTPIVANQNMASAFIYGYSAQMEYNPIEKLKISLAATYTFGRYNHLDTLVPLDHIPPFYGNIAVVYALKHLSLKSNIFMNGAKMVKDYNPYGEDNIQYATPNGLPSWYVWNFYLSTQILRSATIVTGIENILDLNYRAFASGISAPGRNFILKLTVRL